MGISVSYFKTLFNKRPNSVGNGGQPTLKLVEPVESVAPVPPAAATADSAREARDAQLEETSVSAPVVPSQAVETKAPSAIAKILEEGPKTAAADLVAEGATGPAGIAQEEKSRMIREAIVNGLANAEVGMMNNRGHQVATAGLTFVPSRYKADIKEFSSAAEDLALELGIAIREHPMRDDDGEKIVLMVSPDAQKLIRDHQKAQGQIPLPF